MNLMETLENRWINKTYPAIVIDGLQISFKQIKNTPSSHLKNISRGDVVAIIGDFDVQSIANLINLIDIGAIIVPLSPLTGEDHEYFFDTARVKWVGLDVWSTIHTHTTAPPLLPLPCPRGVLCHRLQRQGTGASIARSKRTADQRLQFGADCIDYRAMGLSSGLICCRFLEQTCVSGPARKFQRFQSGNI